MLYLHQTIFFPVVVLPGVAGYDLYSERFQLDAEI
jgi:hypothetical protein